MIYYLALFGHPVSHSLSPQIHQDFAKQFNRPVDYRLIDVKTSELKEQVQRFFNKGGHGANVTIPHKENIIRYLDNLTERAQQAGAVNTLFKKNNQLWGDNTDGDGLLLDLAHKNITIKTSRILIIGAGGAVRGVLPALINAVPASIHITNRTLEKAAYLAARYDLCQLLTKTESNFDLIINGTSLGHQGKSPDLNKNWFHDKTICYDLSYGTAAQPFLTATQKLGATKSFDGLGMLYGQAALAYEIWFQQKPAIIFD